MTKPRKQPEKRGGAATSAIDDPRFIAVAKGTSRRKGIPIPGADPSWNPIVQSWFRSLTLSGQSDFYEASDWATAVLAAKAYDIFLKTYNAGILGNFVRLSERLGVTITDRKRSRIELDDPEGVDQDEEAADAAVIDWSKRLGIVRENNG